MSKLTITDVTREQLDEGILPVNHVLVEAEEPQDGRKTKGGIICGFNEDVVYAEGSDSHAADMVVPYGKVYKLPESLYYNEDDNNSMNWETEMELQVDDMVWFSIMESYNAVTLRCEGKLYKILPYADLFVAKREYWVDKWSGSTKRATKVICLNGIVLCQTLNKKKISELDHVSESQIDPTRAIVKFIGEPNKRYKHPSYNDHKDLRVDDEVLLANRTSLLFLERKTYFSAFNGDNLYVVIPRYKITLVISRKE